MNDLDRAIVATLRAEAREAEMLTDTPLQYDVLTSRLDDVDRHRRRWQVVVGTLAAAAAVALIAFVAVGRPTAAPTPPVGGTATPSASALLAGPFRSVVFQPSLAWNPPAWTGEVSLLSSEGVGHATWEVTSPCGDVCAGTGFVKVRSAKKYRTDQVVAATTPDQYIAHLRSLEAAGLMRLSEPRSVTVGGLPGTAFTASELASAEDTLGCTGDDGAGACYGTDARWTSQVVVLDDGGETLVAVSSTPTDNPDRALYEAQFQAALDTVRFGAG